MSLFRKKNNKTSTSIHIRPAEHFKVFNGSCGEKNCESKDLYKCGYKDKRGQHCYTIWCTTHMKVQNAIPYCRRHWGVISAITPEDGEPMQAKPDLKNRAPSLVNWVSNSLEADITAIMQEVADKYPHLVLSTDSVRLVFFGTSQRVPTWDKSWKLSDHTGIVLRVSIQVEEKSDTEITLRVNNEMALRTIPPWIAHRVYGEDISEEQDQKERKEFKNELMRRLRLAIDSNLARHM